MVATTKVKTSKRKDDLETRQATKKRKASQTLAIKQGAWFNPSLDTLDCLYNDFMTLDDGNDYLCCPNSLELILVPDIILGDDDMNGIPF